MLLFVFTTFHCFLAVKICISLTLSHNLTIIKHVNETGDMMKWSKNELFLNPDVELSFEQELVSEPSWFENLTHILDVTDIFLSGFIRYHAHSDMIQYHMQLTGNYVLPCAITLEKINLPFDLIEEDAMTVEEAIQEINSFYSDSTGVDLFPIAKQVILMEAPKKVIKKGLKEYPKGKGWEVVKEDMQAKDKQPDPRLAKFKDFKPE